MEFLADESCDFRVVLELRRAGHDVSAMIEIHPGSPDLDVCAISQRERRVLLTEDRDFGQLVFAGGVEVASGVLFVRCPERYRSKLPERIVALVQRHGERIAGSFVVWTPRRVRFRRSPARPEE